MSKVSLLFLLTMALFSCSSSHNTGHVGAEKEMEQNPVRTIQIHGKVHTDKYAWVRGESPSKPISAEVQTLISQENELSSAYFESRKELTDTLYDELVSKSASDLTSIPTSNKFYTMQKIYEDGAEYPARHVTLKSTGESFILLDENERAQGLDSYAILSSSVSPDGKQFAWVEARTGGLAGVLMRKDLTKDSKATEVAIDVSAYIAWNNESNGLYHTKASATGRDSEVWYTSLVGEPSKLLFSVEDEEYTAYIVKSVSGKYLFMIAFQSDRSETYLLDLDAPNEPPQLFISKEQGIDYAPNHIGGEFFVWHDARSPNYSISKFTEVGTPVEEWTLVHEKEDVLLGIPKYLSDYIAFKERKDGSDALVNININTNEVNYVQFDESEYTVHLRGIDVEQNKLRILYQSKLTPLTPFEIDLATKTKSLLLDIKFTNYDKSNYVVKRMMAPSHDGVLVPITLLMHKDNVNNPIPPPMLVFVYGAYGDGIGPEFPRTKFSLVDRGFTYAVAHVRGGNELGKQWHEDGKLMKRKNTFEDFKSVINFLIDNKYAQKGNVSLTGDSASGQVIGVAINDMPGTFLSVSLDVPFVDVLNTLLDDSLEYTLSDWGEFGNPLDDPEVFDYIKSYSPYDNIVRQDYPHLNVIGATSDLAVGYWEPMKWVFRIREMQTNPDALSLLTIRGGGHASTGRYSLEREYAHTLAFILSVHKDNDSRSK